MAKPKSMLMRTKSLKAELHAWIQKNDVAEDTFWMEPPPKNEHGLGPELVLAFEGDLHSVLWVRPFEDHDAAHSGRLRREFDAIVKKHGFFFEFKNEVTGNFYSRETL